MVGWLGRVDAGVGLQDRKPGPEQAAVHSLMGWERDAIIAVYDDWHTTDRSYRKLAHRGSREYRVHASESTFWRVLSAEGLVLPKEARQPAVRKPWPDWVQLLPCQVCSSLGSSPERRAEREGDVECRHDQETDRQDHGHSWAGGSPLGVC